MNILLNSSLDINTSVNVNSTVAMNDSVNYVEMCNKCLELEAELIKQHNMVEKDEYNRLLKSFFKLEQHCISLELAMQLNKEFSQKNNTSIGIRARNMSSNTPDYIYLIIVPSDSDVEDAFSSTTTLNYTSASPDYSPASPGNISPDHSDDLFKYLLASLAISPFHDDPYMKVMQAYNATSNGSPIPPQVLIAPQTVLPPSPVLPLSPMFEPQNFFLPEEILPPKKRARS
ncbi:hypothetical protein Tco_0200667 [Tanacetum coccineum]